MNRVYVRTTVALVLLFAFSAVIAPATIADDGRVGTPVAKRSALATAKKKVVLVQGACTELSSGTFDGLKTLLKGQYGYAEDDFLLYSYKGGTVDANGVWRPNAYGVMDPITQDFATTDLAALHDQLLVPYRARNPNTTFVLIAHSLGGMVAMQEVTSKVSAADYQQGSISQVITIDSPLRGVTAEVAAVGAILAANPSIAPSLACLTGGPAVSRLAALHSQEPATTNGLIQSIALAQTRGVSVVNVGNVYDCVWEWRFCSVQVTGDLLTQWVIGSAAQFQIVQSFPPPCLQIPQFGIQLAVLCFQATHGAAINGLEPSATVRIADSIGQQSS